MSDPTLQPTSTPLVLGQTYTISGLFTYVPGTGPDGEPVVGVRVGFYPNPNEVFTGTTPDVSGLDDYTVNGDVSGVGATSEPSWSSGTVTFLGLPNATTLYVSGYLQFIIGHSAEYPNGWVFADPVSYAFNFGAGLFTTGADTVDFTKLQPNQVAAINSGADLYHSLAGNDTIVLPNVANYQLTSTVKFDPTQTFFAGDGNDTITGGDGNYNIALGAGTDSATVNGNGNSNITAGGGSDTITINGTGHSIITPGSGTLNATIGGGGIVELTSTTAPATGSITFAPGINETLQVDGTTMPTNVIKGFAVGDTIDLAGVRYIPGGVGTTGGIAVILPGNFLTVTEGSTTCQLSLDPTQSFSGQSCSLSSDGHGGTDVTLVNDPTILDYLEFSDLAYEFSSNGFNNSTPAFSNVPSGWVPGYQVQISVTPTAASGLTAFSFVDTDASSADYRDVVIAFRGTINSHDLFTTDGQLAIGIKPSEFDDAVNFIVQQVESAYPASQGYSYFVTGHSLGGAEAEDAAAVLGLGGDTFAAPGVGNILTAGGVLSNGANLTDYVVADDPVGNHTTFSGQHVGTVVTLPSVHFTSTLFGGLVGMVLGLREHSIVNYGQALADAGLIPSNPLPPPSQSSNSSPTFDDLNQLIPNIANVTTQMDAAGNVTETGTLNVSTNQGTAVETISEEETQTNQTILTVNISSGVETASETATLTSVGLVFEKVLVDGVNVSTPLSEPADVTIAPDGTIVVEVPSSSPGQELTIDALTNGSDAIYAGAQLIGSPSTQGLSSIVMAVSPSGNPSFTTVYLANSKALDGYLSGATVFADANGNGQLDLGEASATTDSSGSFSLTGGSGQLVAVGGTDVSTGLPFKGQLSAPAGSMDITPLATLLNDLSSDPAAEEKILTALGLPAGLDLTTLDPIAAAQAGDTGGAAAYVAGAKVYDTVSLIASALSGSGGSFAQGAQDTFSALATALDGAGINLTDKTALSALISGIATAENLTLAPGVADAVVAVIAASNAGLDQKLQADGAGAQLLSDVAAGEFVAQGPASDLVEQAAGDVSELPLVVSAFTGTGLSDAVNASLNSLSNGGAPIITGVFANPSSADLNTGKVVDITLTMSEAVTVTGAPTLALNDLGNAVYVAAKSTPTTLAFEYTVAPGDNTTALAVMGLTPNGGSIQNSAGTAADLSGASATFAGIEIDTTPPTIAINPISGDDIINATESGQDLKITGTTTDAEDGQVVSVVLNGTVYTGQVSSNAWSVTVPKAAVQGLTDETTYTVTADVSDRTGNPAPEATCSLKVDTDQAVMAAASLSVNDTTDHVINAVEAKAVSFTVSGLDDETGTVTFGDGTKSVSVPIGGNGTFVADLSRLNDGPITSILSVSDPEGNAFTKSGNTVELDAGPSITAVTPAVVEKGQTTQIGTVTPGLPGDTLTLKQTGGNGTLALQLVNGTEEVIYTAPAAVAAGTQDTVSYTVADQNNDVAASGSVAVQLDAGPSITAVTPSVVEKGQTTVIGTVTPGLAGDTPTLKQTGGNGTLALQLVNGVEEVIYTAPSAIGAGMLDTITYSVGDQHNDAAATGSNIVPVAATGDTIYVGSAGHSISVGSRNAAVDARAGKEHITVGNGNDFIVGGNNDIIVAGNGNDTVFAGTNSTITAGNGKDSVTVGANSSIKLGSGNDTVIAGTNSTITAGNGKDSVTVGANSSIKLGSGNDTMITGDNSTVTVGNGNDSVTVGANSSIKLGGGKDTVIAGANSKVTFGNGNDTLFAGMSDLINLGRGNDTVAFGHSPSSIAIGNEIINGFNPARDIIQFNPALLANYMAVQHDMKQVGHDTVIQIDPITSVTLANVAPSALTANNFHFA
jgi:Ca2+-binding RTX toxin-like protein